MYWSYRLEETLNVPRELTRILEELELRYKSVTRNITLPLQGCTTLFVLRMFHSKILIQQRALDNFEKKYDDSLKQITLGRALTTKFLQEIASISNYADRQHSEVKAVSLVVEALLDVLSLSLEKSVEFQKLNRELRAISNSLTIHTGDLAPRMEARLKFFEISRNIQESTSLWLLSLLAAIFLPLSLASSLLSMQTRLTELHYLLYDFFRCNRLVWVGSAFNHFGNEEGGQNEWKCAWCFKDKRHQPNRCSTGMGNSCSIISSRYDYSCRLGSENIRYRGGR